MQALRVVNAATMPRIPSSNMNVAVTMIGEEGADLILPTAQ
jgi:choline dehydrogenase-like flavoprotein